MRSRTVDASIREEEKQAEVAPLEPLLSCEQKEDYPKTPVLENGMENRLVLTPYDTSSVWEFAFIPLTNCLIVFCAL